MGMFQAGVASLAWLPKCGTVCFVLNQKHVKHVFTFMGLPCGLQPRPPPAPRARSRLRPDSFAGRPLRQRARVRGHAKIIIAAWQNYPVFSNMFLG